MAARVGISKAMMSKIENAQTSCSLSTLALLAKGFDVPVTSLFRGADVERPPGAVERRGRTLPVLGLRQANHRQLRANKGQRRVEAGRE